MGDTTVIVQQPVPATVIVNPVGIGPTGSPGSPGTPGTPGAPGAAGPAGVVPLWTANTPYAALAIVFAPDGTIVQAPTAFTSGAVFNPANWAPLTLTPAAASVTYSPLDRGTAAQLATWKSKQATGTEYVWNLTDGAGGLLDIVSGVV